MTYVPTLEQCQAALPPLKRAYDLCGAGAFFRGPGSDPGRKELGQVIMAATTTLGLTVQAPKDVAREKALVEAIRHLWGWVENWDCPFKDERDWAEAAFYIRNAMAAYDPPAATSEPDAHNVVPNTYGCPVCHPITSTPSAPHDGRAINEGEA